MLPERDVVGILSEDPPRAVLERLESAAAEWRESRLTATARAADILGWHLRTHAGGIILRAWISGRNGFLPYFKGSVQARDGGSVIAGEIRLSWFSRVFALIWLGVAGLGPLISLAAPVPRAALGERAVWAILMILPCSLLFAIGVWAVRRSYEPPAAAIREFLTTAAQSSANGASRSSVTIPPGV